MTGEPWRTLADLHQQQKDLTLEQRFALEPDRAQKLSLSAGPLFADFSKQAVDVTILQALAALAEKAELSAQLEAMTRGEPVNQTEQRSAAHNRLRQFGDSDDESVRNMFSDMAALVDAVHSGTRRGCTGQRFRHVVNIGIGGSDFGPRLVCDCLRHSAGARMSVYFVSNIDPQMLTSVLAAVDPESTLFLVSSKSFGTDETLSNARAARRWLQQQLPGCAIESHFVAVTANPEKAEDFGVPRDNQLLFPDWVGGRFSVWSAIGLPVALGFGMPAFSELLAGGREIDIHVRETPLRENLPLVLGLIDVWNINLLDRHSLAILPYDHSLRELPAYLQQLFMESTGKSVTRDGALLQRHSGPVVWGSEGTNGQHSFHQLLHQGTEVVPCDFILPLRSHAPLDDQHEKLVANCLGQGLALMRGQREETVYQQLLEDGEDPARARLLARHKAMPGNRPSTTICLERTDARSLGALIALYEYRMFTASAMWQLNAFDQWGVELGKTLSKALLPAVKGDGEIPADCDSSTRQLLARFRQFSGNN